MADKKTSPSFRAVEKLGIENKGLESLLKSDPLFQYGYDPSVLVQRFTGGDYTTTDFQSKDQSGILKKRLGKVPELYDEIEKRGLEEDVVYIEPKSDIKNIYSVGGLKEKLGFSDKEANLVKEYLGSLPAEKAYEHEFQHRGIELLKENTDFQQTKGDHMMMYSDYVEKADKKYQPVLRKLYNELFGTDLFSDKKKTKELSNLFDEVKDKAALELEKRADTRGKYKGGYIDKPLYQD